MSPRNNSPKISGPEKIFITLIIFLAVFVAKFPTLYHALNVPRGYWFTGNSSFYDAWDNNFYVSIIRYAQRNGLAIKNMYTTVPHNPAYIYLIYSSLGVINKLLKLDPFVLFHAASIIASVILILVCFYISKLFFNDRVLRLSAFTLMVLGGGLGWIPELFKYSSDTRLAGFTMVSAFERSHEAISTLSLILSLGLLSKAVKNGSRKTAVIAALAATGSIVLHPPLTAVFVTVGALSGFWYLVRYKKFAMFIYTVSVLLIFGIYFLLIISGWLHNPGFAGVVGQAGTGTAIRSVILGLGLLTIPLVWSFIYSKKTEGDINLVKLFFLVQLAFLLTPFGFHLYFAKGLHVWAVVIGVFGLAKMFPDKRKLYPALTILVLFSLITRYLVYKTVMMGTVNNPFFYLTSEEGNSLAFMSRLPKESAILSLFPFDNFIPAYTDNKIYIEDNRDGFYTSLNQYQQRKLLKDNNIQYIYYGLEERYLRKKAKLPAENPFPYFPIVYRNNSIILYGAGYVQKS